MKNETTRRAGAWEVRRKIHLETAPDPETLARALDGCAGVKAFRLSPSRRLLTVGYDITITDYVEIRETLAKAGFRISDNWWHSRKARWFQSLDLTGRENAGTRPSPCCNKPPTGRLRTKP